MVKYQSVRQLKIEEFKTPFLKSLLLANNRWVELSGVVPWDKFAAIYMSVMNLETGRPGLSPRIVLGAMIIKHLEKLDDRGAIAAVQENPYMQYFVGLEKFTPHPVFDPSLFVEIRKRIGHEKFDELTNDLIRSLSGGSDQKQVEVYRILHGHYPELVQADQIYATKENRKWLKERDIRITAPPLGRPKAKEKETPYFRRK